MTKGKEEEEEGGRESHLERAAIFCVSRKIKRKLKNGNWTEIKKKREEEQRKRSRRRRRRRRRRGLEKRPKTLRSISSV